MKKTFFVFLLILINCISLYSQNTPPVDESDSVHFNNWALIIYRPENNGDINTVRCWLKLEDEAGNDVTYTAVRSAQYEWVNGDIQKLYTQVPGFSSVFDRNVTSSLYKYRRTYYLDGGMAMHLNIKPGKYNISFYTPADKTNMFECDNRGQWNSNVFTYDTENPAKVIFLCPTANENGFYNGGWWIDYKAPKFFKHTQAKQEIIN